MGCNICSLGKRNQNVKRCRHESEHQWHGKQTFKALLRDLLVQRRPTGWSRRDMRCSEDTLTGTGGGWSLTWYIQAAGRQKEDPCHKRDDRLFHTLGREAAAVITFRTQDDELPITSDNIRGRLKVINRLEPASLKHTRKNSTHKLERPERRYIKRT